MNLDPRLAVFADHRTVRQYKAQPLEAGHWEQIMYCAQHAPSDATAQMYSFVRLTDPALRSRIAELTGNAHMATASETLIVCADVHRLQKLLEHNGYVYGDWRAASLHFAIGDAHDQLAGNDAFEVNTIGYLLRGWQHLAGELDFTDAQRAAFAFATQPTEVETDQLPHRIQAQAARHDRIADKVATEEP